MKRKPIYIEVFVLICFLLILIFCGFSYGRGISAKLEEVRKAISECNYKDDIRVIERSLEDIKKYFESTSETESESVTYPKEPEIVNKVNQKCELPDISTKVKLFTDYKCYDLWYTPHYRLQKAAWTDKQGLRRFNNDYIVALGSFYSVKIGDRFEITLDTGRTFTVIFGDGKADVDCDDRNMYTPYVDYNGNRVANLLEFIVDEKVLDSKVYDYGDLDMLEGFEGDITGMIYLGRDESRDWDTYEYKSD